MGKRAKQFRSLSLGLLVCLTFGGCASTNELEDLNRDLEELDQLNQELDDALNDLGDAVDEFDAFAACMEMYDYNPPAGVCE